MKRKTIQGKEIIYLEVMYIVSGTKPFLMVQIKDINKIFILTVIWRPLSTTACFHGQNSYEENAVLSVSAQ